MTIATQESKRTRYDVQIPGNIPCSRNQSWSNWGRTAHCQPDYLFYPRNAEDLIQIVKFACEMDKKVRAVATGHSWSALVPTDEILVNIQNMHHITLDLSDSEHPRVVMESGATVQAVNDVLEKSGYAIPFNVVLESVRFGGLIATGSHGSGWNHQTLSDLVHSIEIISANGELRKLEAGVDSEDVMNAARLSLGMFGLIYRITLNVLRCWTVRALDRRLPIEEVLENLADWVPAHENMDLFWWPFSKQLWVKSWDPVDSPITARPRYNRADRSRSAFETGIYQSTLELLRHVPRLTPRFCPVIFGFTPSKRDQVLPIVEAIHYRRSIEAQRMGCVEVAFKIDPDFSNVKSAMQVVFDLTRAYATRREYPINVTMNVRFINSSNCWLSPAFGPGHTCYIEILSRTDQEKWQQFSGEVAREWFALRHALPHWAKEYRHIPGVLDQIKHELGGNIERFKHIKADLGVDPDHMFTLIASWSRSCSTR